METKLLQLILDKVTSLETGQKAMQEEINTIKTTMTTMVTKDELNDIKSTMATKDELNDIKNTMATKDELNDIKSTMATKDELRVITADMQVLKQAVFEMDQRLIRVEHAVSEMDQRLIRVEHKVTTVAKQVAHNTEQEVRVNAIEKRVSALESDAKLMKKVLIQQ